MTELEAEKKNSMKNLKKKYIKEISNVLWPFNSQLSSGWTDVSISIRIFTGPFYVIAVCVVRPYWG